MYCCSRHVRLHAALLFPKECLANPSDAGRLAATVTLHDDHATWAYSAALGESKEAKHAVHVKLPAHHRGLSDHVEGQCDEAKLLLCRLAFAYKFDEPVLVTGPTCFKNHIIRLFSTMVDFSKHVERAGALL